MKEFLGKDFLLESPAAVKLYESVADLPIIDFHCHLVPREIAEDQHYDNITEVWLGHDHYKWRAMRFHGVPEELITGDADPREKFRAWAGTLQGCVGNPLYHWSHLELYRYFGITEPLTADNCDRIYDACNALLRGGLSAQKMILTSNVDAICTTDDPCDSLEHHKKLQDEGFAAQVVPSYRPDNALRIHMAGFVPYVKRLEEVTGRSIAGFADLCAALDQRLDFFCEMGCRVSDHALERTVFCRGADPDTVVKKALAGERLTEEEIASYQTALLLHLGAAYCRRGVTMQLHVGCMRNINTKMFKRLGPDTGYDAVLDTGDMSRLAQLLDALTEQDQLPRTIVYSVDENSNRALMTVCTSFTRDGEHGYVQLGPAWWFNDTKNGMEKQLRDFCDLGCLADCVGMLTDSRSFLSYTRHEYFRRILCNFVGNMVDRGEYPADFDYLGRMLGRICYGNAAEYFRLGKKA